MPRPKVRWLYSCAWVKPGYEMRRVFTKQANAFDYAEMATKDGHDPERYIFRQTYHPETDTWTRDSK